jgi:CubicO group peptidase (beta-lactamase class C family)
MAQHGNFGLDDNVNTKLKSWQVPDNEFTATAKVTVRGILSHTAGLTVPSFPGYDEDDEVPSVLEILDGKLPARTLQVRVSHPRARSSATPAAATPSCRCCSKTASARHSPN